MEGRVCHRWQNDEGICYGYLLDNGHLLLRTQGAGGPPSENDPENAILELDWDGNLVWAYRNPMVHHDFERLPNGNTLICEGAPGRLFEVTPDKEIVWEYINPFVVQRRSRLIPQTKAGTQQAISVAATNTEWANSVFRAHRYGADHPALQGKNLEPDSHANLSRLYTRQ